MQITLTIPDELAAQAHERGLSVEAYIQELVYQAKPRMAKAMPGRTREQIERFFQLMTEGSEKLPDLPTESFTRESFYEDRH